MCRWIAYRGETIPLEQYVTAPDYGDRITVTVHLIRSTRVATMDN